MAAVVLERKNANLVRQSAIVDGVRKARHEVASDIGLDNAPAGGSILNNTDGMVSSIEKLPAKRGNSSLVKLSRLDEFRFSIGW